MRRCGDAAMRRCGDAAMRLIHDLIGHTSIRASAPHLIACCMLHAVVTLLYMRTAH
jgi:hypothetical protein